jgi:hypothetical protein
MRINLVTPFSEKDAVKALGARWDAAKKLWYVVDVTDLTPFMRWIPNLEAATGSSDVKPMLPSAKPKNTAPGASKASAPAKAVIVAPHCGCDVLPWDDCEHTARQ